MPSYPLSLHASAAVLLCLVAAAPVGAQAPAQPQATRVTVSSYEISGNTLLPTAQIDGALAAFTGSRSLDELKAAARAVQALYAQAGYGGVVAFLPEQPLGAGRVRIEVLEGRTAQITLLGNAQFSTANVRAALPALREGVTPPVRLLDTQVQLANENPARQIALTLEEGRRRGEVDVRVNVSESPVSRFGATLDNTGNAATGRLRLGLNYAHANLLGGDEQLSLQAQVAPEKLQAVKVLGADYRVPLYAQGWMLNVYGLYSDVDAGTTSTTAGNLTFSGKGRVVGVRGTTVLPRWDDFEQRLSLSVDQRDYLNNCSIEGLGPEGCGSAGKSVRVQPLGLDYSLQRGGDTPLALNLSLVYNLGLGGPRTGATSFTEVRPGAPVNYSALRLGLYGSRTLAGDWRVSGRFNAQYSADALINGEQMGVAGSSSVRGYEERELTGDVGATASVEVLSPLWLGTPGKEGSGVRMSAFADAGWARNRPGQSCNANPTQTRCGVASVGLGARFAVGGSQWQLDLAQALKTGRSTVRNDTRVHLHVQMPF